MRLSTQASNEREERARDAGGALGRAPLWLALATFACYANSLRVPFLFDDPRPGTPLDYGTRSLVSATFALNRALSGEATWSFHLFNVLVHLASGLVLLGFLRRTLALAAPALAPSTRAGLALASALVWLCHPLQTAAVTYLSQRAEALGALCFLACMYAFVRSATAARPRRWQVLTLVALVLGFAAKEIIATAPLVILLHDATFLERGPLQALRRRRGFYAALGLTALALFAFLVAPLLVAENATAGLNLREHGPLAYARTQPAIVLHYLRLILWPHPLVLDYGWPVARELADWLPATLLLVLVAGAALHALARRRWPGFAAAWFLVILLPTSSFVPIKDLAFEHRVYLSLAAPAFGAVLGGWYLCRRLAPGAPGLPRALAMVLVLLLCAVTIRRNHDYRSSAAIWRTVVARAPANPRGYTNLATALKSEGHDDEALALLQRAVEVDPSFPSAHFKLGNSYLARQEFALARTAFERSLALSDDAETRGGLAIALFRLGRFAEAEGHFRRALELDPQDSDHHFGLANVLGALQRPREAEAELERVLALAPGHAEARANLATLLLARGAASAALEHCRIALAGAPDEARAALQLGQCLEVLGRTDEALQVYREAVRRSAGAPEPVALLARLLGTRPEASPAERSEALTLATRADAAAGSRRADLLEVLALVRAASGDHAGAIEALEKALALPGPGRNPELAARLRAQLALYRRSSGR